MTFSRSNINPDWELPDPDDLKGMVQYADATQRRWLLACRDLAESRVPEVVFKDIPDDVWTLLPWGHRLTVVRCPSLSRIGLIHLAENAKTVSTAGWVLSVSPEINRPDGRLPYWYPFHPLTLPGQLVAFGKWSGQTLPVVGTTQNIETTSVVILNIADIFAPIFSVNEAYWTGQVSYSGRTDHPTLITKETK